MSQLNIPWSAAALQKTRDPIWIHLEHWPKPEWHGSVRFSDSASSWSSKKRLEGSWDHSFQVTTQSIHETGFRCSISRTLQLAIVVAKKLLSGRNRTTAYLGNAGKVTMLFQKKCQIYSEIVMLPKRTMKTGGWAWVWPTKKMSLTMILEAAKTKKQNPMELLVEKSSYDSKILNSWQLSFCLIWLCPQMGDIRLKIVMGKNDGRPLDLGLPNFHTYPGSKSIFAETTAGTMSSGTVDPETLLSMLGRWIECDWSGKEGVTNLQLRPQQMGELNPRVSGKRWVPMETSGVSIQFGL